MSSLFRGSGVLAIWNGIAPGHDSEFLRWHVGQHLPERMSVPGFLRARRYVSAEAHPRYFNFYEVTDVGVLESEAYLARLNAPTDWTRAVVPHFIDTSRTLCEVLYSEGHGCGGVIETLRIEAQAEMLVPLVATLVDHPDISGVSLLARHKSPAKATSESQMRAAPDRSSPAILLIEGADASALASAGRMIASDNAIAELCGRASVQRGVYHLDFLMD
ncbi:hypothetical protein SAMN05880561_10714 [Rhizobium sp. RU33A]|uniref:hypothetical protein n=1 Tax=Rhizobium sp. RU33A TaxID=1907413 RepID=UPI000956129F|nr:hypothetical protein [Rhizobium sp. RU33A]SIR00252.1 hypothetical protein SAMN05880561_10714 [Rhizobium sp. RU33A]